MLKTLIFWIVCFLIPCSTCLSQTARGYTRNVGDIFFDPQKDGNTFIACDTSKIIHWYTYEVGYEGNTPAIAEIFGKQFSKKLQYNDYTGYVMVRFVVNCYDQTGMFRTEVCDASFLEVPCPEVLRNDLITITKTLKGWKHAVYEGRDYDSYMCLTFKMNRGEIVQILPLL